MSILDFPSLKLVPDFSQGSNSYTISSAADGVQSGLAIKPNGNAPIGLTLFNTNNSSNYGYADILVHPEEPDKVLLTGHAVGTGTKPLTLKILLGLNVDTINCVDITATSLTIGEGIFTWNTDERTLNLKMDGSNITQQIGIEQYFPPIHNNTGSTITNGTLVGFSGAINEAGYYRLTAQPYIANGTLNAEHVMGVATEDITTGNDGFITTFGAVRELNTTGSIVGETWAMGDILYAHPTQAGKFTKVKPTAPNISIPVAAVIRVDSAIGEIFVRPTVQQRLYYGSFLSTTSQTASSINTPYAMTYNVTDISSGFSVVSNSRVTAAHSGLYNFQFSAQMKSDRNGVANVWIWPRINGVDVPNSASKVTISDKTVESVSAWNFVLSLSAGQYFELMWAVDDITITLNAPAATAFCPATPSVILTITQVNL